MVIYAIALFSLAKCFIFLLHTNKKDLKKITKGNLVKFMQKDVLQIIKEEKARQKMTLFELSQKSGIARGTLNKIMAGDGKNLKAHHLQQLAEALNLPMAVFVNEQTLDTAVDEEFLGFVKVSASTCLQKVGDIDFNVAQIKERLVKLSTDGVKLALFGEMNISCYTIGDLVYQQSLLNGVKKGIAELVEFSKGLDMLFVVGAPLEFNLLYNCAVVIFKGRVLGIIPKSYLPEYNEFGDKRLFAPAPEKVVFVDFLGQKVPFGADILFKNTAVHNFVMAVEICEDIWVATPPSSRHATNGATIVCNLSASNERVGKPEYRRELVTSQSSRTHTAYIYANVAETESTTHLIFAGHNIISEGGKLVAETPLFTTTDAVFDIDLQLIATERHKRANYVFPQYDYVVVDFDMPVQNPEKLDRVYKKLPFVPAPEKFDSRCEFVLDMQSHALATRMNHIGTKTMVVGVSGGSDSTLALIVANRTAKLVDGNVVSVVMPGFGSTDRTQKNAIALAKELSDIVLEIDIKKTTESHLKDINHSDRTDTTFENAQARIRTLTLFDVANKYNGLVLGTGDLSELALGFCTYNGDHMSNYAVNSSVPKTLVFELIRYYKDNCRNKSLAVVLEDILETPVSPELLEGDGKNLVQITENIIGPYVLHDFFMFHTVKNNFSAGKILYLANQTFGDEYTLDEIYKWQKLFIKKFFANQFKRNCMPDGPTVGAVNLSDFSFASDANANNWLADLETMFDKLSTNK